MAHRASNRQRNHWVVSLLDVQPGNQVLEIGFSPGLAIAQLSRRVGASGHVYGIDHSDMMLRQVARRNAAVIAVGRVTLSRAPVDQLPPSFGGPFDVILAVNSLGFLAGARRAARRVAPAAQARRAHRHRLPAPLPGATANTSRRAAPTIEALLRDAGYTKTRAETLDLDPPVICVLAISPDPITTAAKGL